MQLIGSRAVLDLTGLSSNQLREWTVRRALIPADIPAQKRGSEAKFSWQTVLLLRLTAVLKNRFIVELKANQELLCSARSLLKGVSFPALTGNALVIHDFQRCELVASTYQSNDDAIILHLDPHLEILSRKFGFISPDAQLPLFPAIPVTTPKTDMVGVGDVKERSQ